MTRLDTKNIAKDHNRLERLEAKVRRLRREAAAEKRRVETRQGKRALAFVVAAVKDESVPPEIRERMRAALV